MKHRDNGAATAIDVRVSEKRLDAIGPGDSPEALVKALEPSLSVAAALLMVVNPGPPLSVTHHSLRLPQQLLDGWMRTQPQYFEQSLSYAVHSHSGDFWQGRQDFSQQLLKGLEVMEEMDGYGLGDGAGLKIDQHVAVGGRTAHVALAVMTHRGEGFPHQTTAVCHALAPALRKAVFRLSLPLSRGQSIHARVLEEDNVGFVCLSPDGETIVEVNQRAYDLALRYRSIAGLGSGEFSLRAFVRLAGLKTCGDKPWQLIHPDGGGIMQVRAYSMPREHFDMAHDLPMLKLEEWSLSPPEEPDEFVLPAEFHKLTPRQSEIAKLLVEDGRAPKQIASDLKIAESTVRKHIENMHKTLKVQSTHELVMKALKSRKT